MNKRLVLVLVLSFAFILVWQQLGRYMGIVKIVEQPAQEQAAEQTAPDSPAPGPEVDATQPSNAASIEPTDTEPVETAEIIEPQTVRLENDRLFIDLDNKGGVAVHALLKDFYATSKQERPISLISSKKYFPGEVVLADRETKDFMYKVEQASKREAVFTYSNGGMTITKTFTLEDGFKLACKVKTTGIAQPFYLVVAEGLQPLLPGDKLTPSMLDFGAISPKIMHYTWSENGDHESDTPNKKLSSEAFEPVLEEEAEIAWAGVKDTYFANVFVPDSAKRNLFIKKVERRIPQVEDPGIMPVIALQGQNEIGGYFYMGPILETELQATDPKLENLLTYGWAGLLSKWLFLALAFFHNVTGNWGWSIIILTFIIRVGLVPLTIPSVKSSYKMRKIQPKIEKLKQKYGGQDLESKQKMSQEQFKLYKEEGVNPFSSCFTALAQMPVFIAYFSLLRSSIHLRQAEWMFWIGDLSVKDPTYILPIFMGLTMFFSTLAMPMPTTGDPAQQKMMKAMPVIFSLMFLAMPAGLILYMITSNLFALAQTTILKWRYEHA